MEFDRDNLATTMTALAAKKIYIGTSSWKYAGWRGQLYDPARYMFRGKVAESRFERDCLTEYSQVFKTVCVDAGFYQFPTNNYLDGLCAQVPDDFLFSFKVTEDVTVKKFPSLPRYGARAGQENPDFLNPVLFIERFLSPCEPFRSKIGLLIFEFSQFRGPEAKRPEDFILALELFLFALPAGWEYGVEIRNESFLLPGYFEMLNKCGVLHVMNNWTRMPSVAKQMTLPGNRIQDRFASRFLLKPGREYEEAVNEFSPYSETKVIDPEARSAIAGLTKVNPSHRSYLYVNNRLEGNALNTIAASCSLTSEPD
jgi:uncharacterized protein YecE (DUF72 family)